MTDIELAPGQDQLITHAKGGLKLSYNKARTRVRVTAPGVYWPPPVDPPPVDPPPPPIGTIVAPGQDIRTLLAQGHRTFSLRTGTHKLSLSSAETTYSGVSFLPYPGDSPVIDGTGLDPHFVYLGPQSGTWTLGVALRNFYPTGSGVIGIGDGCRLETVKGFSLVGKGGSASNQDHGVYFHGTGTGRLIEPDIHNFPGSALQTYRGSPVVEVQGGRLHGLYVGVFVYSGSVTVTGTSIIGSGLNDVDWQTPSTFKATSCTGKSGGPVRVNGPHS